MILGFLALVLALVAIARAGRLTEEVARLREELEALRTRLRVSPESTAAGSPNAAASAPAEPRSHAGRAITPPLPPASASASGPAPAPADDRPIRPPAPEPEQPWAAGSRPAADAPAGRRGLDLETRVGATWALRLGLAAVAIAVALFARTLVPALGPGAKVALAYAGALGLFGVGKVFEARLERFARPVMAAGLAIAFFVSYASHFVPAMRALPLVAALVWMAAGVVALLVLAERWGSEPTAGLAIFLGHVSAFVAGGVTEVYSVVVVIFLAAAAGVLLYRHAWLPLSLFAVVASYASHVLWAMADRSPAAAGLALTVNLLFLASYYGIFLGADLLWWARRGRSASAEVPARTAALARSLGPVNLALATTVTALLYVASGGPVERLAWVFFGLAALQGALAPVYRRLGNPDHGHYPALGTVLATLGFAALLDGLSLSLVLALEAVALLVAAHATRMRVFHLLAQAALAANFVHYWADPPAGTEVAAFIGGLAIAAAYLVQARLEEAWYGGGRSWAGAVPAGVPGRVARAFDAAFGAVAPALPWLHALGAALLATHQSLRFSGTPDGLLTMALAATAMAAAAIVVRSPALLLSATATQVLIVFVPATTQPPGGLLLGLTAIGVAVPTAVMATARLRGFDGRALRTALALAEATVLATLLLPLVTPETTVGGVPSYLAWVGALAVAAGSVEMGRRSLAAAGEALSRGFARLARGAAALVALLVAAGAIAATERFVGGVLSPVWTTGWAAALIVAALRFRQPAWTLAAATLLLAGDAYWLVGDGLGDEAVRATGLMAVLAGVPLAAGVLIDRLDGRRVVGHREGTDAVTHALYLLGSALALWWCEVRLADGWSSVAFAVVPAVLVLATWGAGRRRALDMAVLLALVAMVDQVAHVATTSSTGFAALLVPGLLLAAGALALDRTLVRASGADHEARRFARLSLLFIATALAMVTVNASDALGGPRTTIGWSLVGGALMAAGFAARSADYRRVALGVLGIAAVRVFAVDTRGLSDAMKTLAFLALGLSLIAVAWLYSRFGRRLRDWL